MTLYSLKDYENLITGLVILVYHFQKRTQTLI